MATHTLRALLRARALGLSIAVFAMCAAHASAGGERHHQEHGRQADCEHRQCVEGRIRSTDGKAIPGATIVLARSGRRFVTASDRSGRFAFENVESGTYEIVAGAPGYQTLSERAITIRMPHATLSLTLSRATTAALATIGEVSTSAGAGVSTASGPSVVLDARQAAASGSTSVAQMLWSGLSLTPVLPLGGGSNATVTYAVRGPDPTETLVSIDGHQVNNGNTGDYDLSLLDPAALQAVQVVYGIAPSSLIGPNTIGGAVNVMTLQPTQAAHALLRLLGGSYGTFGATVQSTGSSGRIGYAFSLHGTSSSGSVNETIDGRFVGSGSSGASELAKLRYQLGGMQGYGYVQVDVRDQTLMQDLSALLTTYVQPGYQIFPNTAAATRQANYGLDAQIPLGGEMRDGAPATMLSLSHLGTWAAQSVWGPGAGAAVGSCANGCQYLYNQRDVLGDDWLQVDHRMKDGLLTFKYDLGTEALNTEYVPGQVQAQVVRAADFSLTNERTARALPVLTLPLSQTERSGVLRYDGDPGSHVHYSVSAYLSDFSTFGTSLDPRAGLVWAPTGRTAVRASVGTTFQTPQLSELVALPAADRVPVGGVVYTGNPNLKPDRATEYDVGADQLVGGGASPLRLSADLYQDNLRAPSSQLVVVPVPGCQTPQHPKRLCPVSFPVNAGAGVYRGMELRADVRAGAFELSAGWSENSSFLTQIPQSIQDGTLVPYQQTLGEPLHKAYLGFEREGARGWIYGAELAYEGEYNELNRPAYATLDAHVAYRTGVYEIGLYGTNLTNVYANPFTIAGGGVPYGAQPGNPMTPTDAYALQGSKVVLVLTRSM